MIGGAFDRLDLFGVSNRKVIRDSVEKSFCGRGERGHLREVLASRQRQQPLCLDKDPVTDQRKLTEKGSEIRNLGPIPSVNRGQRCQSC